MLRIADNTVQKLMIICENVHTSPINSSEKHPNIENVQEQTCSSDVGIQFNEINSLEETSNFKNNENFQEQMNVTRPIFQMKTSLLIVILN